MENGTIPIHLLTPRIASILKTACLRKARRLVSIFLPQKCSGDLSQILDRTVRPPFKALWTKLAFSASSIGFLNWNSRATWIYKSCLSMNGNIEVMTAKFIFRILWRSKKYWFGWSVDLSSIDWSRKVRICAENKIWWCIICSWIVDSSKKYVKKVVIFYTARRMKMYWYWLKTFCPKRRFMRSLCWERRLVTSNRWQAWLSQLHIQVKAMF